MIAIYAALVLLGVSLADEVGPPAFSPDPPTEKPFGAYYCQARCLASCLETFLAPSLEDCQKYCPPFDDSMLCSPDNAQCWQTCGVPILPNDPPAPESPDLTPVILGNDQDEDPFVIELTWSAVTNASLYIVEFFPHNREPKPGESNFFQVMTTSLTYKVRKDDECIEYSGRVIAVNSYGISRPTYAFIGAPLPSNIASTTQFAVRNMQRDPWSPGMVTVTMDYTLPPAWPLDDIDIDSIRVSSLNCKGPLGDRSFGNLAAPGADSNPSYTAMIGKTPTTAIQLSFYDDMVKSDCIIQMRIAAITTRCNTTVNFEEDLTNAPGIDFRINCDTVPDACNNDTEPAIIESPNEPAPIPVPTTFEVDPAVIVPPLNTPGHMPPGIDKPEDINGTEMEMPTPPSLPLFIIGQGEEPIVEQPMPPAGRITIVDVAPNGTDFQTMAIIPQTIPPPLCELEMIDVEPALNQLTISLLDVKIMWLERQPLPPPPPASYFVIRYGPIIRRLVDDEREPNEIIPGYEIIERTGQGVSEMPFLPDPVREINITAQRGSLMKIQICAIYDPSSEALIQWDAVRSRRIDLAALEPFLEFDADAANPSPLALPGMIPADLDNMAAISPVDMSPVAPIMDPDLGSIPFDPNTGIDETVEVPLLISVNVEHKTSPTSYWMMVMAGLLLIVLTLMLIFVFLRRMCISRRHFKHCEKPMVIVTTPAPKPIVNEMVKVPLP